MEQITITLPTIDEVKFTIEAEQDESEVRGNAMASGDDAEDKRVEDGIIDRLLNGDVWGWAAVTVTGHWKGIESDPEHLGWCTYADEEDFIANSGYYEDMKKTCYDDIIAKLKALQVN